MLGWLKCLVGRHDWRYAGRSGWVRKRYRYCLRCRKYAEHKR